MKKAEIKEPAVESKEVKKENSFSKEEILKSRRLMTRRDALSFLLKEDQTYTMNGVEKILNDYMKGKVN